MLAELLALAVVLAAPGPSRPRAALDEPLPDNAARARRGLLPRKATGRVRGAQHGRRVVLLPQAPTWLGEPADPPQETPPDVGAAAAAEGVEPEAGGLEPVVAAAPLSDEAPAWASLDGADVELLLVRRLAPEAPQLQATIEAPELQVLLVRRPGPAAE